jgi:hypothetical protein
LALAVVLTGVAWRRSVATAGYYDGEVYGMTPATHRRYALAGLAFVVAFAISAALRLETSAIVALAIFTPIAVLYATSFARGADDE